eukprot:gene9692-11900_t
MTILSTEFSFKSSWDITNENKFVIQYCEDPDDLDNVSELDQEEERFIDSELLLKKKKGTDTSSSCTLDIDLIDVYSIKRVYILSKSRNLEFSVHDTKEYVGTCKSTILWDDLCACDYFFSNPITTRFLSIKFCSLLNKEINSIYRVIINADKLDGVQLPLQNQSGFSNQNNNQQSLESLMSIMSLMAKPSSSALANIDMLSSLISQSPFATPNNNVAPPPKLNIPSPPPPPQPTISQLEQEHKPTTTTTTTN